MTWSVSRQAPPFIQCQADASEPMRFAASELARYLERVLGAPMAAREEDRAPRIILETTSDSDLGDEGYRIAADDAALTITGGGDAGVVYGVYDFLRRYAGCLFSGLGPDGEFVPRRETVEFVGPRLRMKPQLWYRGLPLYFFEDVGLTIRWVDWMAKNGLNYVVYAPMPESAMEYETYDPMTGGVFLAQRYTKDWFDRNIRPEMRKRALKLDMNHHNLFYWLPPSEYFAEHPEWFAMVDGKRSHQPHQLCICTSNDQAVETLVANVTTYLRQNPDVKIVGILQEDGRGVCQCSECVAGDTDPQEHLRPWRGRSGGPNYAKIDRYANLLNRVARAIRDEFPGVLVGGAAYIDMAWPSQRVRLEPNTVMWMATYWRDGAHVLEEDSPSPVNRFFADLLRQWRRASPGRVITYSYYMGMSSQKSLPYPMDRIICRDWRHLKAMGIEGAVTQCWPSNHDLYALNLLAFARCGWSDDVDPDALRDEYLRGMFGSAADAIRPMFDAFHEAWRRAEEEGPGDSRMLEMLAQFGEPYSRGVPIRPNGTSMPFLLDVLGEDRLDDILAAARQAASDDRERRQVEKLAAACAYWKLGARVFRTYLLAETARKAGDEDKARALFLQAAREVDPAHESVKALPAGWASVPITCFSWRGWQKLFQEMGADGRKN